jgi:hypothetical protein
MIKVFFAVTVFAALAHAAIAEPVTVYRDSMGRVQGYASKHGNTTTFSNSLGQQTGRAERGRDGIIRFFDASGRSVGSAKK